MGEWVMQAGLVWLCLCVALSGCIAAPSLPLHLPGTPRATDRTEVLDGAVTLAAPDGFCVDHDSRQDGPEGAFVLWGSCAAIGRSRNAPQPAQKVVLSATVGPNGADPVETGFAGYADFFRSEAGRAALARSGLAQDVAILDVQERDNLLLLKVADHSAPTVAPVEAVYWRAITGLEGHVSALSVLPLAGRSLDDPTQLALLETFVARIRAVNAPRSQSDAETGSPKG